MAAASAIRTARSYSLQKTPVESHGWARSLTLRESADRASFQVMYVPVVLYLANDATNMTATIKLSRL